ncbi:hypothetical protein B0H17DRAFT_1218142 [Mycena rosella]|uniref:F-box domain-containing protein n=1 Tax=Mycena rosella TaxID=1033263 RepID=A0AAD7BST2_MYCRO|nr:hypothetical protein B0H17DRAFT_1218142 [Mycena rosella]
MVLTRRAYKAISRWLPNEIITEIVQLTLRSDQASLSRVSTLFRDLCLPILYRVVRLNSRASVAGFGAAVLSNNALAELVRSYTAADFFGVPSSLLMDSSKALIRLESLSLHQSLAGADLRALLGLTFPHLVRCRLRTATLQLGPKYAFPSAEKQDVLMSFLLRHPALENLHIEDPYHMEVWPSQSARIPLLHLQRLRCPAKIVPSIDTTNLRRARLCWNTGVLILSNPPKSKTSSFRFGRWPTPISPSNMPNMRTLQLGLTFGPTHIDEHNEIMGHLKNYLPRFMTLAFLSLEYTTIWPSAPTFDEKQAIDSLSTVCPTLEACRLHDHAWRKMAGRWEEYAVEEFEALAGLSWTEL